MAAAKNAHDTVFLNIMIAIIKCSESVAQRRRLREIDGREMLLDHCLSRILRRPSKSASKPGIR
jgi:hypothetical protein